MTNNNPVAVIRSSSTVFILIWTDVTDQSLHHSFGTSPPAPHFQQSRRIPPSTLACGSRCGCGLLLCDKVRKIKAACFLMLASPLSLCPRALHRPPCSCQAAVGSGPDHYNAICCHNATPTERLATTRHARVRRHRRRRWELMTTLIGVNWWLEGRRQEEVLQQLTEWHHFLCFLTWAWTY